MILGEVQTITDQNQIKLTPRRRLTSQVSDNLFLAPPHQFCLCIFQAIQLNIFLKIRYILMLSISQKNLKTTLTPISIISLSKSYRSKSTTSSTKFQNPKFLTILRKVSFTLMQKIVSSYLLCLPYPFSSSINLTIEMHQLFSDRFRCNLYQLMIPKVITSYETLLRW